MKSAHSANGKLLQLSDQVIKDLCRVFKLMADKTRLRILLYLNCEGELSVMELCERLNLSQPTVSHHLALMRVAGIVQRRREGKHNYYSVRAHHLQELMEALRSENAGNKQCVRFLECVLSAEG